MLTTQKQLGRMAMFQLIDSILHQFRDCFKREKTWRWFVILILGIMIRNDHRGVTSVVSSMRLKPQLYHTMLHYFRAKAYLVKSIYEKWIKIVVKQGAVLYSVPHIFSFWRRGFLPPDKADDDDVS